MFVVVVAFLFVLIVGSITFTDVVDQGLPNLKSMLARVLRTTRTPQ